LRDVAAIDRRKRREAVIAVVMPEGDPVAIRLARRPQPPVIDRTG
jgi:hypothetical protein